MPSPPKLPQGTLGRLGDAWVGERLVDAAGVPVQVREVSAAWAEDRSRLWLTLAADGPTLSRRWVVQRDRRALRVAGDAPAPELLAQLAELAGAELSWVDLTPDRRPAVLAGRVPPFRPAGGEHGAPNDLGRLADRLSDVEHKDVPRQYALWVQRVFASWEAAVLLLELRELDGTADADSRLAWWPGSGIRPLQVGIPVADPRRLTVVLGPAVDGRLGVELAEGRPADPADRELLGSLALPELEDEP